jgi:hypothetical protein
MYNEKIVDVLTGEETLREFSANEVAEIEKAQALAEAELAKANAKEQARKQILESLGLTEEQIQALIG